MAQKLWEFRMLAQINADDEKTAAEILGNLIDAANENNDAHKAWIFRALISDEHEDDGISCAPGVHIGSN